MINPLPWNIELLIQDDILDEESLSKVLDLVVVFSEDQAARRLTLDREVHETDLERKINLLGLIFDSEKMIIFYTCLSNG